VSYSNTWLSLKTTQTEWLYFSATTLHKTFKYMYIFFYVLRVQVGNK